MKKRLIYNAIIILLIMIEILLIYKDNINKNKIAQILEIENINDISIKNIKISNQGQGSEAIIYIKFKIATQKYEEYQLEYSDESSEQNIYEGEVKNKKLKENNNYICYYEKVANSPTQQQELTQIRNTKYYLIIPLCILLFRLFKTAKYACFITNKLNCQEQNDHSLNNCNDFFRNCSIHIDAVTTGF